MRSEFRGKLLRIFVGEHDRWKGQPLYAAIVEKLRELGMAGATVLKGIEGYGGHGVVHAARVFDLSSDLPIIIEVIDTDERVAAARLVLDEMVREGLVTVEAVDVVRYRPG